MLARVFVTAGLLALVAALQLRTLWRRGQTRELTAFLAIWALASAVAVAHAAGFRPPGFLGAVSRALRPWGERLLGPLGF